MLPVAMVTAFLVVPCLLSVATPCAGQLEGPQKVVSFLKVRTCIISEGREREFDPETPDKPQLSGACAVSGMSPHPRSHCITPHCNCYRALAGSLILLQLDATLTLKIPLITPTHPPFIMNNKGHSGG